VPMTKFPTSSAVGTNRYDNYVPPTLAPLRLTARLRKAGGGASRTDGS